MLFQHFTERAQKAMMLAQEESRALGHNLVGTEHLLLGLIREGEGVAARALARMNVNLEDVRKQIVDLVGEGQAKSINVSSQVVPITPRVKRVLELAMAAAAQLGHRYVGTEHLLLGLIREGEGVAARVLQNMGVDLEKATQEIINLLQSQGNNARRSSAHGKRTGQRRGGLLHQFGRDLTELAEQGKIDPVIGRGKEIERVIQVLSRRTKNNPCLIGEPGVGKTAIAEGLAQRIVEGKVPETLRDKRLFALDMASMVAGTKFRGEFEDRLKKVIEELRTTGDTVIFVDELHTIVGAGGAEGAIDASNILKPALARGEIQIIGATTLDEYRKHIEKDAALERRFQPIMVDEPTVEETIAILKGLRDKYEAHHRVKITDAALEAAAKLSDRYITDRFLPDKAIDLIDEAGSRVRLRSATAPPDLKNLEAELEKITKEKEAAIEAQEFEKAAELRDREHELTQKLQQLQQDWESQQLSELPEVDEEEIAAVVSSWTNIPVSKLQEDESERLLKLEEVLHQRVIGQEEAVSAVARAIRRARAGLKDPKRPIGSFIFLGPTGVGKTELARALAEALFGDEDAMIRIDMSEYMERHAVSRLVGSPPGYVGYDEGGQLTEKVRRKPYSVVLFDEVEKAHPEVFNILLQVLEDGRLTDAHGRTVDFRNTVVIMTSNVGASTIRRQTTLGFRAGDNQEQEQYEALKENVMSELRRTFRPEFLNRIDETIVFHPLNEENIRQIVDLMLREVTQRLDDLDIQIEVTDAAKSLLAKLGYNPEFGARPLRRVIRQRVEDRLSEMLLRNDIKAGQTVVVDAENNQLTFEAR